MFGKTTFYAFPVVLMLAVLPSFAETLSTERFRQLKPSERMAWDAYLELSNTKAKADREALQREVSAHQMSSALRAPSGGDFKLKHRSGDTWFASVEAQQLADSILSFQTPSGGWSKHIGFSKGLRQIGMQWTSQNEPGEPWHYVATFDNNSTTSEIQHLANVWLVTKREDCRAGVISGLDFVLAAQFPNGGWPQGYPLEGGYHDNITFNDDAFTHVLELLYAVTRKDPCFAFLDDAYRQRAADAFARGIDCVCKLQMSQNGKKTVWCAQYDPLTLHPAEARKMEPVALSGLESANILRFLMTIDNPRPELVACIEAGLEWLDQAQITGLTQTKVNGKTTFQSDAASTKVYWARFYDITTGKPVFPGRDGILYDSFNAMAAKNELGYDFYTTRPESILRNGQKKWRKSLLTRGPG